MAMLTEHDVVNMRFKEPERVEAGYDQDEVDFFLDEVAETIAQLVQSKADCEAQLHDAQVRVAELENGATPVATSDPVDEAATATNMLALAKRLHDEHVSKGKAESERLVAEGEAERTRLVTEAEEIHNRTLTKLEEERALVEHKIAELREFERDYRTRLKSYLESLLTNVETHNSSSAGDI